MCTTAPRSVTSVAVTDAAGQISVRKSNAELNGKVPSIIARAWKEPHPSSASLEGTDCFLEHIPHAHTHT